LGELPLWENSEKLVLVVSLLETVVDTEVSKIALVRCSLFGNSVNYTDAKLITNMERITQLLVNDYSVSVPNFWFGCYKITEVGLSPPMMDDKKRNIRTKDFYLYYLL
jgi:hypothetical protein